MSGRRLFRAGEPANAGQVRAELCHAAGQMAGARAAKRAGKHGIVNDCVAAFRARRRLARDLARPQPG